jgi:tRNA(Ile)-lysidine synthase
VPTIEQSFSEALAQLKPDGKIVAGVSGGADSMALLGLLEAIGQKPVVAHFNHQLRGEESDADEAFVRDEASKRGFEFRSGHGDVRAEAKGISIEMAARKLRHAFLAQVARDVGGPVVLAHHADDQIELVLLRARRGIEGYGASGMREESVSPADPNVRLLRPLLHFRKSELKAFLETKRIPFREDSSNAELNAQRNWIRHKTIPALHEHFGPQIEAVILEQVRNQRNQDDWWRDAANAWIDGDFNALPERLQKEIIITQLERLGVTVSGKMLDPILNSDGRPVTVAPDLLVTMDTKGRLKPIWEDDSVAALKVDLHLDPTSVVEYDGVKISWSFNTVAAADTRPQEGTMVFDAERVGQFVTLRHPQAGDSIRLSRRSSGRSLFDMLGRNKIPKELRSGLIVAETEYEEIFWVEGLRITEEFKVSEVTEHVLEWQWSRASAQIV